MLSYLFNSSICVPCLVLITSIPTILALNVNLTVPTKKSIEDGQAKQGWTPQPDGRGTMDILWSCSITMFICSWSILCMNLPGPKESRRQILWRKFSLTVLGILCPEILFELAIGQWLAARQSVKDFSPSESGQEQDKKPWYKFISLEHLLRKRKFTEEKAVQGQWTMKAAFFVDMGGFTLHTRDHLPFPIDAKQLHYLVSKGHLPMPRLDHRVIEDKNKVDGLLRTITIFQIGWFLINTIARWAQDLVVTSAELTTVSFILCSLGTAFCWWSKPADAVVRETIESDISIDEILQAEGQPLHTWKMTPLDFVNRREWWWSRCWANFIHILNYMHLSFGSASKPIDRVPDTLQKEMPKRWVMVCMILTVGYFSVFFLGWNSSYPTQTEQTLWRAASVTMMVTLGSLMTFSQLEGIYSDSKLQQAFQSPHFSTNSFRPNRSDSGRGPQILKKVTIVCQKVNTAFDKARNNSPDKDPQLYVPLRLILPLYVLGVFYCHARAYILVADVLELRSLPKSAYASVDWQRYVPHLG